MKPSQSSESRPSNKNGVKQVDVSDTSHLRYYPFEPSCRSLEPRIRQPRQHERTSGTCATNNLLGVCPPPSRPTNKIALGKWAGDARPVKAGRNDKQARRLGGQRMQG